MKKYACKYVVLRFSPCSETEEFANVGILLHSKVHNVFLYKLDTIDIENRVANFFHMDDKHFYISAISSYEKELSYMKAQVSSNAMSSESAYELLVRPRATLLSYSKPRVLLTDNVMTTLEETFNRMVTTLSGKYR